MLLLLALAQSGENVREPPPQPPPRAPELTRAPSLVEFRPADYPPERLARGEEADVGCLVDIAAEGRVTAVAVDRPAAPAFVAAWVVAILCFPLMSAGVEGKAAPGANRYGDRFVCTHAARSVTRSSSTCPGRSTTRSASCRTCRG